MPKVRTERRSYRKSPGRQYGYEYDPLRSRSERSSSGQDEYWSEDDRQGSRLSTTGDMLSKRPNPKRTRQLMRRSIIASKTRAGSEEEALEGQESDEQYSEEQYFAEEPYEQEERYRPTRSPYREQLASPNLPSTQELMDEEEEEEEEEDPQEYLEVDPDAGYDEEAGYEELESYSYSALPPASSARYVVRPSRALRPRYDEDYADDEDYQEPPVDEDYEEEERPRARTPRRGKKRKVSRRGLIVGLGAAAIGGVAAYELAPRVPQAIGEASATLEHQIQDAFNRGLAQGADNARRELLTSLENLEGFTLEGAVAAARLTRVAYDVFVSPIIAFGASITTDFLGSMLKAFKTARMLLAGVYQDNATLQSIQKVLETWVAQVSKMPQQLNTITQSDLDGAQAYLRQLQAKINEEKARLNTPNGQGNAPAAPASAQPTAKPGQKP